MGVSDWGLSRTFDAARVSIYRPGLKVDLIEASPVLLDAARFDHHKPGDHVFGSYVALQKWGPKFIVRALRLCETAGRDSR